MNMNKTLFAIVLCAAGLQGAGSISGTVVDPAGAPIPGSTVKLRADGIEKGAESGPEGQFTFAELALGAYSIEISHVAFKTATVKSIRVADELVHLGRVTLEVVPRPYFVECHEGPPRMISSAGMQGIRGTMTLPPEVAPETVTITIREIKSQGRTNSVRAGDRGRFSFSNLLPGRYTLTEHLAGYVDFVIDEVTVSSRQTTEIIDSLPLPIIDSLPLRTCAESFGCAPNKTIPGVCR
jgi:hypothetical protein